MSQSKLAEQCGIQRTYLSHVLSGKAHLSGDQVFKLSEALGLKRDEESYFQLLVEIDRCGVWSRKARLIEKKQAFQREAQKTTKIRSEKKTVVDDKIRYYSDPLIPLVHMFLLVNVYKCNRSLICSRLGLSPHRLDSIIVELEALGVIKKVEGELHVVMEVLHLNADHPLSRIHGASMRQFSAQKILLDKDSEDYFFSSTLTIDQVTFNRIRSQILALISSIAGDVEQSESQEVYQINVDFYRH